MKQRQFGNTGKVVSEIGLGTWQIGGAWGDVSDNDALQILETAASRGVTFFDTADVYGDGRSEQLIRRFLATHPRDDIVVATKQGRWGEPGWPENFSLDVMRRHANASRERLGLETLDLLQLHCIPTEELARGDVFDSLRILQNEGLIRNFGVSVESMEEALICLEQPGLSSLQIIFNIFRQKPIDELFDAAQENGVGIIVRLPLASGLLSGKMTHDTHFAETDHRNFNRDGQSFNVGETFAGLPFNLGVDFADELMALVPEGMTMAQMALRWILDFDAVSTIIPGASRPDQVLSNVSVSDLPPLSPELHEKLRTFYREKVASAIRGKY